MAAMIDSIHILDCEAEFVFIIFFSVISGLSDMVALIHFINGLDSVVNFMFVLFQFFRIGRQGCCKRLYPWVRLSGLLYIYSFFSVTSGLADMAAVKDFIHGLDCQAYFISILFFSVTSGLADMAAVKDFIHGLDCQAYFISILFFQLHQD